MLALGLVVLMEQRTAVRMGRMTGQRRVVQLVAM